MTVAGWIIMVSAIATIVSLLSFCIYKVLATPGSEEHLHSTADIHTPDVDDPD